jgi:glycosyltransferase involved in cell wall biosynthesis
MKKTILHIIDNLGRGGAETMLVTVLKQLPDYRNIVVTLGPENEFGDELHCDEYYCLNMRSPLQAPAAAWKLRSIIRKHKVEMVHSHLFWSTVVARIGVPAGIPLISTVHAFVASSIEYRPWHMRMIEKWTYRIRRSTIVAVAKGALDEYFSFIGVQSHNAVHLYTFADTAVFSSTEEKMPHAGFRLVTVGNLKAQKNQRFLLEAFKELKNEDITLDIYGKGPLQEEMQQLIDTYGLKVNLKGQVNDIEKQLGQYDLFVMSSLYEGFSLSVLEAMAMGMPTLLSDISSFKEQCGDTATYFRLNDRKDFIARLLALKNNRQQLQFLGKTCKQRVQDHFTLRQHMLGLRALYSKHLPEALPAATLSFSS